MAQACIHQSAVREVEVSLASFISPRLASVLQPIPKLPAAIKSPAES
jgi:hypothetical protein